MKYWFSFYFVLRGIIVLENKTFVIEPASGRDSEAHFIYRVENLRLTQGDCGHGFNMTSVPLENHIKNPFQSFHTRVRTALAAFIKLDFIALLLAVATFQCCIGVRSWAGGVFISVVNKKDWAFDPAPSNWQVCQVGSYPRGYCLGPDTFYLHLEPKVEGPLRAGHWLLSSRCSIHLSLFPCA